jgi:prepilin-type N-terminal cleavage/methylation domain-containing protein
MKKHNRGFSLLEVLVTVGIILVLVSITMPALRIVKQNNAQTKTSNEIIQLDTALMAFFNDTGSFPMTGQMLASLNPKYFEFDSSRINGNQYIDSMGKPYFYQTPGKISAKGYDLYSTGLLMAKKDTGTLGRILESLGSSETGIESDVTSGVDSNGIDVIIGNPSGADDKTIWGLPEPLYDIIIKGALALLQSTNLGFDLYSKIMLSHIPIGWDDLLSYGAWALYDVENHGIWLDISLLNGPAEAVAAILGHEATHLSDHLANGEQYFDSVQEEYDAFYNSAKVWEELLEDRGDVPIPSNEYNEAAIQTMILTEQIVDAGEEAAKDIVRQLYYYLPENEEYGDAYTVPKNL